MRTSINKGGYGKHGIHFNIEVDDAHEILNSNGWSPETQRRIEQAMRECRYGDGTWYDRNLGGGPSSEKVEKILKADSVFYDNIKPKLALLKPPLFKEAVFRQTKRRRKRTRSDHGNEIDIHAVNQGRVSTAWSKTKFVQKEVTSNRNVHLIINSSLNGATYATHAEWRTACAIAVHDELVKMGKSVSIGIVRTSMKCFTDQTNNTVNTFYIPIKKLGEHMSVNHLAAYTSATFTRLVMMYKYSNSIKGKHPVRSYGYAVGQKILPDSIRRLQEAGQYVVFINHCFNESAAKNVIQDVIKQVGGNFNAD